MATEAKTSEETTPPVDHIHEAAQENLRKRSEGNGKAAEEVKEKPDEPLLKLKTALEPRPTVEIDDHNYELRHNREFSITEQHQLRVEGDEFDSLWEKKDTLNNKQRTRLKTVLDSMFDKVLLAPPEVKAKLDDDSRRAVVLTFTRAPMVMQALREALEETDSQ